MQKLKLLIPLALFLGVFFIACHEDDPFGSSQVADVTFAGQIIAENGNAVSGALVKAGNESAITDENGIFRLKSARLHEGHAMITVIKEGYFDLSRPYIIEDGAVQIITIQLLSKLQMGTVNAGQGGVVDVGGPTLSFPANAVSDLNGNVFSGQFNVFARYLDPSDPKLGLFIPGDMTAENEADEVVFLATYGMLGVEIQDLNGQKLKIAPGKEVEVRMPIIASQMASAPSEIALWYYDLEDGHWKEEGLAQKVGAEYVGKVTHFSFWNCDASFPLTQLKGKIYLENTSQPLINALVRITMLSTGASSFGSTDDKGNFGGCIPQNEALKLEVVSPVSCGSQSFYSQDIGSFPGPSILPDIIIPASAQVPVLKVKGQLRNCNGQPVSNGYVKIKVDGGFGFFLFPKANGQFEFTTIACTNGSQTGQILGYDLTNLLESAPISYVATQNTINVGNITVCTALAEFIEYTLDGQTFLKLEPNAVLNGQLTNILAHDSISTAWINLSFANSGQVGNFPITTFGANDTYSDDQVSNTLSTNVTAFGNVGEIITVTGTFKGNFKALDGSSHTVSGSYRVNRE